MFLYVLSLGNGLKLTSLPPNAAYPAEAALRVVSSARLEVKNFQVWIIQGERTVIPVVQTAALYAIGPRVGSWSPHIGERFTTELESVGHAN